MRTLSAIPVTVDEDRTQQSGSSGLTWWIRLWGCPCRGSRPCASPRHGTGRLPPRRRMHAPCRAALQAARHLRRHEGTYMSAWRRTAVHLSALAALGTWRGADHTLSAQVHGSGPLAPGIEGPHRLGGCSRCHRLAGPPQEPRPVQGPLGRWPAQCLS